MKMKINDVTYAYDVSYTHDVTYFVSDCDDTDAQQVNRK